ncbi:hypothetical protein U1Q18_025281 [Sarracenia purpurea var. burkii]
MALAFYAVAMPTASSCYWCLVDLNAVVDLKCYFGRCLMSVDSCWITVSTKAKCGSWPSAAKVLLSVVNVKCC